MKRLDMTEEEYALVLFGVQQLFAHWVHQLDGGQIPIRQTRQQIALLLQLWERVESGLEEVSL